MVIRQKVNIIAWLEFELALYDVTILYVSYYVTDNSLKKKKKCLKQWS